MKLELYLIVANSLSVGNYAYYSLAGPAPNGSAYKEVSVDVPDLPTEDEMHAFMSTLSGERRQAEIAALKERLSKLESIDD